VTALRRLLALGEPDRPRFALACLLGALAMGSAVALLATAAWLISKASLRPHVLELTAAVVGVRAFALGRAAFRYAERLASHDVAFRMLAALRVRLYRHLIPLAPAGLPAFRRGDLLARLVADVDNVQDLPLRVLQPATAALLAATVSVGLLAWLLPTAALVLLAALVAATVAVPLATGWASRWADARLAGSRARLTSDVVGLLRAQPDLIAYGAAEAHLARVAAADAELTGIARRSAGAAGLGAALTAACAGAAVLGALLTGAAGVRSGRLDGVALAVVVLVPLAAFEAVQVLTTAVAALTRVRHSGERLLHIVDAPAPVADPAAPLALPDEPTVCLRNMQARWPDGDPTAPAPVNGVDLDLTPGRRVAVVGESGAGKTTLAAVLLRFVDIVGGRYELGGVDARRLCGDDIRRVVGLCAQDAHVFDSTIRENLRLAAPGADDAALRGVLQRVRLLDWVDALPEGLDTFVGERGTRISGGERQRLALARVLLADRPVLVLDEPTANLDPPTADALVTDLLAATSGRTTLLITHRLTGLDAVDEVVVLDQGRVVERGTHAELLAAGGRYRELWDSATPTTRTSSSTTSSAVSPSV
jgi:thiol reductant ABC exporter CydC subunit